MDIHYHQVIWWFVATGSAIKTKTTFNTPLSLSIGKPSFYHFNAPPTCNPHGLLDGSGNCQQAVSGAGAGTIGKGKLGETQVIVSGGKIIIDTKVKDGEVLNNSIQLQWGKKDLHL